MNEQSNIDRTSLLKALKSIRPTIIEPTATQDMGMECTIASKLGITYPVPGMFISISGGYWPIYSSTQDENNPQPSQTTYSLQTDEVSDAKVFTDIEQLETAFLELFNIDAMWESFDDDELSYWLDEVSEGSSIAELSEEISE